MLGWSQAVLYGSAFKTGYHPSVNIPRWVHVLPNLQLYPRLLTVLHTPILLLGLLTPLLLFRPSGLVSDARARAVLVSAPAFVAVTYFLYAPFPPIVDLFSLRFILPAIAALVILFSALVIHLARIIASYARLLAPLAIVPALVVAIRTGTPVCARPFSTPRPATCLMRR